MFRKRKSILFYSLFVAFFLGTFLLGADIAPRTANAAPAPDFTVDTLVDENDGCDVGDCSLRDAIGDAGPGDTIGFSVPPGTIDLSGIGELVIHQTLTINGGGLITVSGNNLVRVFNVTGGSVTLNGLTIALGKATDCGAYIGLCGGGIFMENIGTTVTVINSTFSDNSAGRAGGAIFNEEGTVTVRNSSFFANSATRGGALYNRSGSTSVSNSTISSNSADYGGGIFNYIDGIVDVENSTLSHNKVDTSGGGISSRGDSGTVTTISNSIVSGNIASATGAADDLALYVGTADSFSSGGNNLIGVTGENISFGDGTTDLVGVTDPKLGPLGDNGGDTMTHGLLYGSDAIDAGNCDSAPAADQRGIPRPQGDSCDIGAYEQICWMVVVNNQSSGPGSLREATSFVCDGGRIIFDYGLAGSTIDISPDGEVAIKRRMSIRSDVPITISGADAVRVFNVSGVGGVTLWGLTIANGKANGCGDHIGADCGGGIFMQGSDVSVWLNNSTLSGNFASMYGGGIYNEGGYVTIDNSTLFDNSALRGGAIYNGDGTVIVFNSTISGNTADEGGGIMNYENAFATVSNSTISRNGAATRGGGISSSSDSDTETTIGHSIVSGNFIISTGAADDLALFLGIGDNSYNSAGYNLVGVLGAGITLDGPGDQPGITDPELGPLADNGGGTLTHALLDESEASDAGDCSSGPEADQRGIARPQDEFCDIGAYERICDLVVESSSSSGPGTLREAIDAVCDGGEITFAERLAGNRTDISPHGELLIRRSMTIRGNVPIIVSGAEEVRVFNVSAGNVTIDSLTINDGKANDCGSELSTCGGGIFIQSSDVELTVTNSYFYNNFVSMNGGAIYNESGTVTVRNSTFFFNSALRGGAIYNDDGALTVSNSTMYRNSAGYGGGILNLGGGVVSVSNSTISRNSVETSGGGISSAPLNDTVTTISNSIVSDNYITGTGDGDDLALFLVTTNNSFNSGGYNLIGTIGEGITFEGTGDQPGENDPQLDNLRDNGGSTKTLALKRDSLAIDRGNCSSGPATDQRGIARPQDEFCDIGAYELVCEPLVLNNNSSGPGSLREAVDMVCKGGEISFDDTLAGSTIDVSPDRELRIERSMSIRGNVPITISGADAERVFMVTYGNVTLDSLTIANGNAQDCNGYMTECGGGIFLRSTDVVLTVTNSTLSNNSSGVVGGGIYSASGAVIINNSTLTGNSAQKGGGIYNEHAVVTINNSTISGNSADDGGGIINLVDGVVTINNSTISNNRVTMSGGGVASLGEIETVTVISNSIVSSNFIISTEAADDLSLFSGSGSEHGLSSGGHNLVGALKEGITFDSTGDQTGISDALLGPLAANGGATMTHALLPGSPAIDAGGGCDVDTDQRGIARPQGDACDSGAFEIEFETLTVSPSGIGGGSVRSVPAGIDCFAGAESDCTEDYAQGTIVTLTATAVTGSSFGGWRGAGCEGTGSCVVTMDGAQEVTATFTAVVVETDDVVFLPVAIR